MVDIVLIFLSMIIIGVSIIYSMRKNIKEKVYYDELQNINRSNAYKCSYIFLVFYFLLTVFLESIFKIQIFSNNNTMIITGILLSALIFACYNIKRDSFLGVNENINRKIIINLLVSIIMLISAGLNIFNGKMFLNGVINYEFTYLVCGIIFLAISIKLIINKNNNREE